MAQSRDPVDGHLSFPLALGLYCRYDVLLEELRVAVRTAGRAYAEELVRAILTCPSQEFNAELANELAAPSWRWLLPTPLYPDYAQIWQDSLRIRHRLGLALKAEETDSAITGTKGGGKVAIDRRHVQKCLCQLATAGFLLAPPLDGTPSLYGSSSFLIVVSTARGEEFHVRHMPNSTAFCLEYVESDSLPSQTVWLLNSSVSRAWDELQSL